jgi:hypothetical protein
MMGFALLNSSDALLTISRTVQQWKSVWPLYGPGNGVHAVPFKSDTYRVLIASPSDLEEERRAATDALNEWNAQHAAAEATVLLPVKWETHATPETGVRPQSSINRQLVTNSDLLVGMFWIKFGTNAVSVRCSASSNSR